MPQVFPMESNNEETFRWLIDDTSPLGMVLNEATLHEFDFVISPERKTKVMFGEYVVTKNAAGEPLFGVVEGLVGLNKMLSVYESQGITTRELDVILNSTDVRDISELVVAHVRVLGKIIPRFDDDNRARRIDIRPNKYPIVPLTKVYFPSKSLLKLLFEEPEENDNPTRIKIGYLLNFYDYSKEKGEIEVYLDLNRLLSRHFAIFAVTGAGKTNTVLVIASNIVKQFGGTVIVFDYHGEYARLADYTDVLDFKINVLKEPSIRPGDLTLGEIQQLLEINPRYVNMMDALSRAHEIMSSTKSIKVHEKELSVENFGSAFIKALEEALNAVKIEANTSTPKNRKLYDGAEAVLRNIRLRRDILSRILYDEGKNDVIRSLEPGALNILDLSSFSEDEAITFVSYVARTTLRERIKAVRMGPTTVKEVFRYPILMIIEEAHVFLNPDKAAESAYWLSRIAREGRKFGVSLGIVSQRPKKLEEDVVSQCNTFIILRLIEEQDRRRVKNSSEMITDDIAESLTSLDVGEALIVGYAVPAGIPVTVKVYDFTKLYHEKVEYGGRDIDFIEQWRSLRNDNNGSISSEDLPL
ncbi:MAG: hypothetical protein DRN30_01775 [Thermoplasmata archaeon]|nr:MAG: hypothetical protein DRN30_01775 [Thermoplasmata archaeon]